MLAGGLGADERARRDRGCPSLGRRRELEPRDVTRDQGPRPGAGVRGGREMTSTGLYGTYGGRYVPETLIPALDELDAGWEEAKVDPSFQRGDRPARPRVRRPPDAADARRALRAREADLPEARGPPPHGRAQAEQRARPGRARPAARQAADRRRDGRRAARRRDGDRLRALRPRVRRLHGRRGHAPPAAERRADGAARRRGAPGRVRDEDAEGGDERGDPRLDHERRDDALPDRLLRRPASVSRDRPRPPGA